MAIIPALQMLNMPVRPVAIDHCYGGVGGNNMASNGKERGKHYARLLASMTETDLNRSST